MREVEFSEKGARAGVDNSLPPELMRNVQRMAGVMEIIRAKACSAIHVSSWYRSPKVNSLVGGSKTSAHPDGRAVDFNISGLTPRESAVLVRSIPELVSVIDQTILEFESWVHVGIAPFGETPRGEMLTASTERGLFGVRTVYTKGFS